MDIATETIAVAQTDLEGLVSDHWSEVNVFGRPLNINWSQYLKMSESGHYHLTTARKNSLLVGWLGFFVYPHLRHQDMLMAREDWYYVRPEYRGAGLGRQMFIHAESVLRDQGIERVMVSCKTDHDHTGLLTSLGYYNHEKNFTKALD